MPSAECSHEWNRALPCAMQATSTAPSVSVTGNPQAVPRCRCVLRTIGSEHSQRNNLEGAMHNVGLVMSAVNK
jgi:hypothetical protein